MTTSIDALATKLDGLTEMQKLHQAQMNEMQKQYAGDMQTLTNAITQLVTQTKNFEQLRVDQNHRMDAIQREMQRNRDETQTQIAQLRTDFGTMADRVAQMQPISDLWKYAIMIGITSIIGIIYGTLL